MTQLSNVNSPTLTTESFSPSKTIPAIKVGNILKSKCNLLKSVTPGAPMSAATMIDNIVVDLDNK